MSEENRELSDEELDNVSGGDGDVTVNGITYGTFVYGLFTFRCSKCGTEIFIKHFYSCSNSCPNYVRNGTNLSFGEKRCINCNNFSPLYN